MAQNIVKYYSVLASLLLLTGCPAADAAKDLANDTKDSIYETSYQIKDWAMTPPAPPKPPLEVADTYCYRVLQDILCHRQPMPGWEDRLVGYQGTHATSPTPAQMELLAKRKDDPSILPANRVANAKPVFTSLPPLPKETEKSTESAPAVDSSHEILPDPALAPEL